MSYNTDYGITEICPYYVKQFNTLYKYSKCTDVYICSLFNMDFINSHVNDSFKKTLHSIELSSDLNSKSIPIFLY